jgi:hypothetical protein
MEKLYFCGNSISFDRSCGFINMWWWVLHDLYLSGSSVPDALRGSGGISILCRVRMCDEMPNQYPIENGILMSEEPIVLRLIPHRWRCCFCCSVLTSDLMRNSRFTVDSHWFSAQTVDLRELHIRSSCKPVQQICSGAGSDLKQAKTRLLMACFSAPPDKGLCVHIYRFFASKGGCDVCD